MIDVRSSIKSTNRETALLSIITSGWCLVSGAGADKRMPRIPRAAVKNVTKFALPPG